MMLDNRYFLLIFTILSAGCTQEPEQSLRLSKQEIAAKAIDEFTAVTKWDHFEVRVLEHTSDGREYEIVQHPRKVDGCFRFHVGIDGTVEYHPVP